MENIAAPIHRKATGKVRPAKVRKILWLGQSESVEFEIILEAWENFSHLTDVQLILCVQGCRSQRIGNVYFFPVPEFKDEYSTVAENCACILTSLGPLSPLSILATKKGWNIVSVKGHGCAHVRKLLSEILT